MDRENRFLKAVADGENFAADSLPGIPLVEICGQKRVLIENHQGIIGYGCNEIMIKVRHGRICVNGENLILTKMCKEKLVIRGKICTVSLHGRG